MGVLIPKQLGHIWIGPNPKPIQWMNTWENKHTDWKYTVYDNNFLNNYHFKTRNLIEFYYKLGLYAGVADLMRYEILYEFGGFIPEADSICYHNTDELFTKKQAYTVYENEFIRGNLVAPIYACEPKNEFVGQLINELLQITPLDLDYPWISTGNFFVAKMIQKYNPDITIFPSHYFNPIHYEGIVYNGDDKIYSKQLFGSTSAKYKKSINPINIFKAKQQKKMRKIFLNNISKRKKENFSIDFLNN
ncbi:glycosyltransferase family 32 protein [Proteus terrae]|uniref:glycosyltransferase family 32 protein n=1 Tax=Proteus terrae TaxID=1574161 RepID=UPI001C5D9103|nr:glycosyltransferase [Proteus terrae]